MALYSSYIWALYSAGESFICTKEGLALVALFVSQLVGHSVSKVLSHESDG